MKFVLKIAISNYYEVRGNFDGIKDTVIGQEALRYYQGLNEDSKVSFSDFLYEQLGYKKMKGFSMEETLKIRAMAVVRKNNELKELLGCKDMSEVRTILSDNGIALKTFSVDDSSLTKDMQEIVDLLAHYYKYDNSIFVNAGSKFVPLSLRIEEISGLKNGLNKKIDSMLADAGICESLVKFHYRKNCSKVYLQGGECFLTKKYSEDDLERIQWEALKKAAFPLGVDLNVLFKRSWNLALLSISNNKNYLNLLDYARANGSSYRDLAKHYKSSIPDQVPIYSKYGILLYNLSPGLYYTIDDTCTEETPIIRNTL